MHRHARARASWIVAGTFVVLASCGGATVETSFAPLTSVTTTTAAPGTVTTAGTATTATSSTTTEVPPTTVDTNLLASGSGCTPGTEDLPDGEWFGLVVAAGSDAVEFDLACWFSGDAAVAASAEDGEESPPPNDYYIRNVNPTVRIVPVAADAAVTWLPNVGDPTSEVDASYADWLAGREARGLELQPGVWVTVSNGAATAIREQYVP